MSDYDETPVPLPGLDDAPEPAERIFHEQALGAAKRGEGLLLGAVAIVPLVLGAATIWFLPPRFGALVASAAIVWSGALLAFLAGVRRGLTFAEAGGARPAEIASMLWVFVLGVAVLWLRSGSTAIGLAMVGFASVAFLDASAARRFQAPSYFTILRPIQMAIALAALAILLVGSVIGSVESHSSAPSFLSGP